MVEALVALVAGHGGALVGAFVTGVVGGALILHWRTQALAAALEAHDSECQERTRRIYAMLDELRAMVARIDERTRGT